MNNSPLNIKVISAFVLISIFGFHWFISELNLDSDTVISIIALFLFVSVFGYFLFPKTGGRKHRSTIPTHKQYDDSRPTDYMMERIMKVYNVKADTGNTNKEIERESIEGVDESKGEETDEKTEAVQEIVEDQAEEINDHINEDQEKEVNEEEVDKEKEVDQEMAEAQEEKAGENQEEDDEEKEVEHKQYEDSRLTDYMMAKIMKAYGIKEETEEESEEVDENQEDETDEGVNEEANHRRYANSSFTNYVMKRRMKASDVEEETKEEAGEVEEVREKFESKPQIAIYDGTEEENTGLIKALLSPVQLPLTLSGLWFITTVIIYNFLPEIEQLIPSSIPPLAFTVLPILILIGLSGFIGVLLEQFSENLEVTFKEKIISALNIFKILIGWGVGAIIFIKFFN
jgi:hypothetical protein